jgi:hypothetical protein
MRKHIEESGLSEARMKVAVDLHRSVSEPSLQVQQEDGVQLMLR